MAYLFHLLRLEILLEKNNSWETQRRSFNTLCIRLHPWSNSKYELYLQNRKPPLSFCTGEVSTSCKLWPLPFPVPHFASWTFTHWFSSIGQSIKGRTGLKPFSLSSHMLCFQTHCIQTASLCRHQWQGTAKPLDFEFQTFQLLFFHVSPTYLVTVVWKDWKKLNSSILG